MRPHRIQVSSSRCDRLEEAEELDTSEEPLLRREPLIERIDLESASSNLQEEKMGSSNYDWLPVMERAKDYKAQHACLIQHGAHMLKWALGAMAGRYDIETDCDIAQISGFVETLQRHQKLQGFLP